jgi:hypothetical protein
MVEELAKKETNIKQVASILFLIIQEVWSMRDRYSGIICVVWYKPFHNDDVVGQVEEMFSSAVKLIVENDK